MLVSNCKKELKTHELKKKFIDSDYLEFHPGHKNHMYQEKTFDTLIDVTKIKKVTQEDIGSFANCEQLLKNLTTVLKETHVLINIDTGDITILNGHHRLVTLKLLAESNLINKYVKIEVAEYFFYDDESERIHLFIDRYKLNLFTNKIEIIHKLNDKKFLITYKIGSKTYVDKDHFPFLIKVIKKLINMKIFSF